MMKNGFIHVGGSARIRENLWQNIIYDSAEA
jgi:hypothetical protein